MRDRDDQGKYNEQYSDEAFLNAVEDLDVASTSSVAEEVGCSYDLAYRRLQTLEEDNQIRSTKVGGSFVWTK